MPARRRPPHSCADSPPVMMTVTLCVFVVAALFLSSCIVCDTDAKCPNVVPLENFNLSAFGSGLWYDYARYPNLYEQRQRCIVNRYETVGDIVFITFVGPREPRMLHDTYNITRASPASPAGNIIVSFYYDHSPKATSIPLTVLAADYDHFCVMYGCLQTAAGRQVFSWILTRQPAMDAAVQQQIADYIASSGNPDFKDFIFNDNSSEACAS